MKGSVVQWRAPAAAERERDTIAAKLWETQGTLRDATTVSFLNFSWNSPRCTHAAQDNAALSSENQALYAHVSRVSAELRLQTDHVLSLMREVEHYKEVATATAREATRDIDILAAENEGLAGSKAFLEYLLQDVEREVTDLKRRLRIVAEDSDPFTPAVNAAQRTPKKPKKRSKTQE